MRPGKKGDDAVRGLRREKNVRQGRCGRNPLHGVDRTGWKGSKTLAQGGQAGRSSAQGAGGRAGVTFDPIDAGVPGIFCPVVYARVDPGQVAGFF